MRYPKIPDLFKRDEQGKFIPGQYASPRFRGQKYWTVTEKIAGKHVRVVMERPKRARGSRMSLKFWEKAKDRSQEPIIEDYLRTLFREEDTVDISYSKVILFGQVYGTGIHRSHIYKDDLGFTIFDAYIEGAEFDTGTFGFCAETVSKLARKFNVERVPLIHREHNRHRTSRREVFWSTSEVLELASSGYNSYLALLNKREAHQMYGIVAKCEIDEDREMDQSAKSNFLMFTLNSRDFNNGRHNVM